MLHEAPGGLRLGGAGQPGRGAPGRAVAGGGGLRQPGLGLLLAGDEAIDSLGDGGLLGPSLGLLLLLLFVLHLKIIMRVMRLIFFPSGFNGNEWNLRNSHSNVQREENVKNFWILLFTEITSKTFQRKQILIISSSSFHPAAAWGPALPVSAAAGSRCA